MIDSVIAGTGDSRYLRTSLAADTTWEDALAMLRAGTFPIDLAGINAAGFTTVGTALTSATLLKAAVCTALGLDANATPSDAWEAVIALIDGKADADAVITAIGYDSSTKTLTATINGVVTDVTTFDFVNAAEAAEAAPVQPEDLYKAFPTDTVSGPIASFPDGAALPIKALTVAINPVQSLNGYDNPWPAGGGVNKLVYPYSDTQGSSMTSNNVTYAVNSDGSIKITTSDAASGNVDYYLVGTGTSAYQDAHLASGTYIVSLSSSGSYTGAIRFYVVEEGQNILGFATVGSPITVTIDSTKTYRLFLRTTSGATANATFYPMIRPSTVSSETWMPYSNICPISGWTGMNIRKTGKNMASPDASDSTAAGVAYTKNPDGSITGYGRCTSSSTTKTYSNKMYLPVGVNFILSGAGTNIKLRINTQNAAGTVERRIPDPGGGVTFALREGEVSASVQIYGTANTDVDETIYPMVRLASMGSSEWEPYNGSKTIINFPSEAGTVYGGTLDVLTGVLTVTWGITDLGDLTWDTNGVRFASSAVVGKKFGNHNILCSAYKVATVTSVTDMGDMEIKGNASGRVLYVIDSRFDTKEAFQSAVNGVQLIFELDEPITYQLTPLEVTTLLGSNNLWADTGDTAVVYRADPTLYIQKLTGSTEDDMIANESIASGKYFMVGNRLFYSTAAIAAGAMLTVGTNCVETNLAAALNALNS